MRREACGEKLGPGVCVTNRGDLLCPRCFRRFLELLKARRDGNA